MFPLLWFEEPYLGLSLSRSLVEEKRKQKRGRLSILIFDWPFISENQSSVRLDVGVKRRANITVNLSRKNYTKTPQNPQKRPKPEKGGVRGAHQAHPSTHTPVGHFCVVIAT